MNKNSSQKKLGILGGGQLARMLAEAAQSLALNFEIYAQESEEPVCQHPELSKKIYLGKLNDLKNLEVFLSTCSHIVFESEWMEDATLNFLEKKFPHLVFVPSLNVIQKLKNKGEQKKIFKQLQCPTAEFLFYSGEKIGSSVQLWLDNLTQVWGHSFILKWTEGGYDGKGVFFFDAQKPSQECISFCLMALNHGKEVYAEKKINLTQECAAVCVRNLKGEFFFYPLVLSYQKSGVCREVVGPAIEYGLHSDHEKKAFEIMKKISLHTGLYGAFAIEFFISEDNELLVNELAPRVHNSGHYTQSVYDGSQFKNHLCAVMGLPFETAHKPGFFYMRNLLGPMEQGEVLESVLFEEIKNADPSWFVYWYGKRKTKNLRKMGHVNFWSNKKQDILKNQNKIKEWEKNLWVKIIKK